MPLNKAELSPAITRGGLRRILRKLLELVLWRLGPAKATPDTN
jgi:hypothetical protein